MKRQWTTFEGRQYSQTRSDQPRVTLGHKHTFYLNKAAFEAIGSPVAVEFQFDGNERLIGIRRTDPAKKNAFRLRLHGKGNYWRLAAGSFCTHFRIKNDQTLLFEDVEMDENGLMVLDLNKTLRVGRGAR